MGIQNLTKWIHFRSCSCLVAPHYVSYHSSKCLKLDNRTSQLLSGSYFRPSNVSKDKLRLSKECFPFDKRTIMGKIFCSVRVCTNNEVAIKSHS